MKGNGCLHTFTRAAYYGGRVEVFRERFESIEEIVTIRDPGPTKVLNYADVNSMYPWAMLGPVPTELAFVRGDGDRTLMHKAYLGFVECTVRIPLDCYLPPLPYRLGLKLVFPVGTFSGTWTSEELALLPLVGGEVLKASRSIWFRGAEVFRPYVEHWYKFRAKSARGYSLALDMTAKLFLNSLYGKFGMSTEREKLWFHPTAEEYAEHEMVSISEPLMGAYKEVTTSSPPYVIPHISAWVTSRSRARLWTLMHGFVQNGYRIYYCDTDSIITDAPIASSTHLGDLKLECQVKSARFVAPKMYFIERTAETTPKAQSADFVKAKGFSGGFGAKGLTRAEFDGLVSHHTKVKVARMRKLREGVRSKERFPAMKRSLKGLRDGVLDEKRIHTSDGNTRPIDVTGLV